METRTVTLTFLEELLGTASANPDIHTEFIASKGPQPEEEVEALPDVEGEIEKSTTVFSRDPSGKPALWDYQIKGFFKDACGMLRRVGALKRTDLLKLLKADGLEIGAATGNPRLADEKLVSIAIARGIDLSGLEGSLSAKLKAYKKIVDGLIFVTPRMIPIEVNGEIGHCERPLRAQTAQGERVALARSETVPPGSTITFEISCLKGDLQDVVDEWLDYGKLRGLGQWRNSGKGRFSYLTL